MKKILKVLLRTAAVLLGLAAVIMIWILISGALQEQYPKTEPVTLTYSVKDGHELLVDVYGARNDVKRPLIIYSYGGSWETGSRKGHTFVDEMLHAGYMVALIDYRLGNKIQKEDGSVTESTPLGGALMKSIDWAVEDLYDATHYLVDNAQDLGIDTDRVIISGSSAGATNSMVAEYYLCSDHPLALEHLPEGFRYAAVVSFSGGIWLDQTDSLDFHKEPCPILMVHGDSDQLVPYDFEPSLFGSAMTGFSASYLNRYFQERGWRMSLLTLHEGDHVVSAGPEYRHIGINENLTNHMLAFLDQSVIKGQRLGQETTMIYQDHPLNASTLIRGLLNKLFLGGTSRSARYAINPSRVDCSTYTFKTTDTDTLKLDVYTDAAFNDIDKKPIFVYSFGGGWEGGQREDGKGFVDSLAHMGYVCVSVDYRRDILRARNAGEISNEKIRIGLEGEGFDNNNLSKHIRQALNLAVEDLYDATTFIYEHAREWGGDKDKIIISGTSAGAWNSLEAEYGFCNQTEMAQKHLPRSFKGYAGVIPFAGALMLDKSFSQDSWKSKPCPIMAFHGTADDTVPYDRLDLRKADITILGSKALSESFKEMGVPFWLYSGEEDDHSLSAIPCEDHQKYIVSFIENIVLQGRKMTIDTREKDLNGARTVLQYYIRKTGLTLEQLLEIYYGNSQATTDTQ